MQKLTINVKDIPFEPSPMDEEIEKARRWLQANKESFFRTANFAIILSDGSVKEYLGQSCHYSIMYGEDFPKKVTPKVIATECGHFRKHGWSNNAAGWKDTSNELVKPFLNWLVNESYLGKFVLNRDLDEILDIGFVVSCEVPTPIMQNLLILTRHFLERPCYEFETFNNLVSKGVDGNLAYALCFLHTDFTNEKDILGLQFGSHRMTCTFSQEGLFNFLKGDTSPTTLPLKYSEGNRDFHGGATLFWNGSATPPQGGTVSDFLRGLPDDNSLREALAEYRKDSKGLTKYSPPNPFIRSTLSQTRDKDPTKVSVEEMIKVFVPWFVGKYYVDGTFKDG